MQTLGKQGERDESSGSVRARRLVREVNTKEFHNMKIAFHQYLTKVFQYLQKKLRITTGCSTFAIEAMKTTVLIWGLFTSSSTKQPFILDHITRRIWKCTRSRTSRKFRIYSIPHRNWYWNVKTIESTSLLMDEIDNVS